MGSFLIDFSMPQFQIPTVVQENLGGQRNSVKINSALDLLCASEASSNSDDSDSSSDSDASSDGDASGDDNGDGKSRQARGQNKDYVFER